MMRLVTRSPCFTRLLTAMWIGLGSVRRQAVEDVVAILDFRGAIREEPSGSNISISAWPKSVLPVFYCPPLRAPLPAARAVPKKRTGG